MGRTVKYWTLFHECARSRLGKPSVEQATTILPVNSLLTTNIEPDIEYDELLKIQMLLWVRNLVVEIARICQKLRGNSQNL